MQDERLFPVPLKAADKAWMKSALFARRDEAPEPEVEDFVRAVKSGKWNAGEGIAMFSGG